MAPLDATDLRKRIRSLIETALGRDLDATYLYGSRARGDAGPDSDWDVLVMLHDHADRRQARAKMRRLTTGKHIEPRAGVQPGRALSAKL
jgi:predicted nucleotidyltransferase